MPAVTSATAARVARPLELHLACFFATLATGCCCCWRKPLAATISCMRSSLMAAWAAAAVASRSSSFLATRAMIPAMWSAENDAVAGGAWSKLALSFFFFAAVCAQRRARGEGFEQAPTGTAL